MGCCGSKEEQEEIIRKISIVGNSQVGKTCLIKRFISDEFEEDTPNSYIPSALQMDEKVVELKNGKKVHLCIYDLGGQDSFKHLRKLNYPKSDAAVICFSLDKKESLEGVDSFWLPEMKKACPDIPLILAGLKRDIRDEAQGIENFVRESHGHNMAKKKNMVGYIECSSASGNNVIELFTKIALEASKRKNMRKANENEV